MAYSPKNLLPAGFALAGLCFAASTVTSGEADQAKAEAKRFIESRYAIRSDGTALSQERIGPVPGMGDHEIVNYWQFDGFSWDVFQEDLTHADKLNGLAWKGNIGVKVMAHRRLREESGGFATGIPKQTPCWRPWEEVAKWRDGAPYDLK